MMRAKVLHVVFIGFCFALAACSENKKSKNPEIRFFNATSQALNFKLVSPKIKSDIKVSTIAGSNYESIPPAEYSLIVNSKNKSLLQKKYGLAKNEKYTAIAFGKPDFSSQKNEATFSYKLHNIFEGSENFSTNGFLPSVMIFSDQVKLKKGTATIRVIHAAAGISAINLKIKDGNSSKYIAKNLAYATPILGNHIKSGNKKIELYFANAKESLLIKDFNFKSQKAYIIIVLKEKNKITMKLLEN